MHISFRRFSTYFIILSLLFSSPFLWADECQSFLANSAEALNGEILPPESSPPLKVGRSRTKLNRALDVSFSEGIHERLLKAEITYSKYFRRIFNELKLRPKQIGLMEPAEIQKLALDIYNIIKLDLVERSTDYATGLSDPYLTKTTFLMLPKELVVDKIGENLVAIGISGDFLLTEGSFEYGPYSETPPGITSRLLSLSVASLSLATFGLTQTFNESWMFFEAINGGGLNTISVFSLVGSVTGGLALFTSELMFKRYDKRKIAKYQRVAELARDTNPSVFKDMFFYVATEKGKLKDSIQKISVQVDSSFEAEPNQKVDLLTYGSNILNLHKDLVDVFVNDFVKWMKIYDLHSLKIKENLNQIKKGQHVKIGGSQNTLSMLSQIFIEAAEGTRQTIDTSQKIILLLNAHLDALNKIDQTQLTKTDQLDWARKSSVLKLALLAQTQFADNLENVYLTISNILAGLDQITVVESSASIRRMGQHLAQNQEITLTVDELLESLDIMDKQLQPLLAVED